MTSFLSTMQYASSHVHLIRGSWYRGLNHLNQYLDDAFPQPCLSSQSVSAVIGQVNHRSFRIAQESKIQEVTIWYSAQCVLCAVRCHCIFSGPGIKYSDIFCVPGISCGYSDIFWHILVVDTVTYFGGNHGSRVWKSLKLKKVYFPRTRTSWDKYMFNRIVFFKF